MKTVLPAMIGWLAAASVMAGPAPQASSAPVKPDPAKAGQLASQVCGGCHGMDGNSPIPANPSLAGQHPDYLAKQLMNFKTGERQNAVMAGMVANLAPEDIRNLGAFYAGQPAKASKARDAALLALGEKVYRGGNQASGFPACSSCHSPNGAGIPIQFPRLAGQHAEYTLAQLKAFRTGERANDAAKMMRVIASKMTEGEMQAVSEYIAGLR
jgi:cytochrome c553